MTLTEPYIPFGCNISPTIHNLPDVSFWISDHSLIFLIGPLRPHLLLSLTALWLTDGSGNIGVGF